MKAINLIWIILLFTWQRVDGQDINSLKMQRDKSLEEIAYTDSLLQQTRSKKENQMQNLKLISTLVSSRQKVVRAYNDQISFLNNQIREKENSRIALENEIAKLKEEYANIIYKTYLNRNSYHRAQYIFAASDFNQAFKRIKYLEQYGKYRKNQAEMIKIKTAELEDAINALEGDKIEKSKLLGEEKKEAEKLNSNKKQQQKLVQNLQSKEKQLKRELDNKRAIYKRLETEISRIMAAGTGTEVSTSGMRMTPEMKIISNEFSQNQGRLPWPVERGVITLGYGVQDHPILKKVKIDNRGIEIMTEPGASVYSVFEGKVSGVITLPGGNRAVLVQHGEFFSVYQNLRDIKVKEGDNVRVKQEIGKSYRSAEDANSEIHFEIWKSASPLPITLDPEKWLSK